MATTKAKTIKLSDLAAAIDKAVEASAGRKLPGTTIIGRALALSVAEKINVNALARDITKQVQATVPDAKLTAKVISDGGITTIGFQMRVL